MRGEGKRRAGKAERGERGERGQKAGEDGEDGDEGEGREEKEKTGGRRAVYQVQPTCLSRNCLRFSAVDILSISSVERGAQLPRRSTPKQNPLCEPQARRASLGHLWGMDLHPGISPGLGQSPETSPNLTNSQSDL